MGLAGILAVGAVGYAIFRGANSQKNEFRSNPEAPSVRKLKTLKTASGRRLIISGWWGVARHINYFGDWLIGYGFPHGVVSYVLPVMGILLVHCVLPSCVPPNSMASAFQHVDRFS